MLDDEFRGLVWLVGRVGADLLPLVQYHRGIPPLCTSTYLSSERNSQFSFFFEKASQAKASLFSICASFYANKLLA